MEREREREMKRLQDEEEEKIRSEKSKNYSGKVDAMNLRARIDYYKDMLAISSEGLSDLNGCYNWIKEILLTNDGKYLFVCK